MDISQDYFDLKRLYREKIQKGEDTIDIRSQMRSLKAEAEELERKIQLRHSGGHTSKTDIRYDDALGDRKYYMYSPDMLEKLYGKHTHGKLDPKDDMKHPHRELDLKKDMKYPYGKLDPKDDVKHHHRKLDPRDDMKHPYG